VPRGIPIGAGGSVIHCPPFPRRPKDPRVAALDLYEEESDGDFVVRWAVPGSRRVLRARLEWLLDLRDALAAMPEEAIPGVATAEFEAPTP
jgi:hypothetical protein